MTHEQTRGRGTPGPAGGTAGRVGVYFCRCGPNLGNLIRLGELEQASAWPAAVDVATHDILCSGEGRTWLAQRIRDHELERVVVAACSPREHEETFRAVLAAEGRSPFYLQLVNLREQVEWIGGDAGQVTEKSRRLVAAALRRVALHRAIPVEEVEVSADVLVIGGGPAGVSAALALARKDRKVVLVERELAIGGLANQLDEVFPQLECASCFMEPVLDRVLHASAIEVLTGAIVKRVRGAHGGFQVEIAIRSRGVDPDACLGCGTCAKACPAELPDPFSAGLGTRKAIGLAYAGCLPHVSAVEFAACLRAKGETCDACLKACPFGAATLDPAPRAREVTVGAIVVATGAAPGEVAPREGVLSSYQLERMLHPNGPTAGAIRGAGGREPASVLLATSAAEGDPEVAAEEVLKLAHVVRRRLPRAEITVAGGLERIPHLARRAAELAREGVRFAPGSPAGDVAEEEGGRPALRLADARGERLEAADLVVVHAPARPAEGSAALARLLRIGTSERGFLLDRAAGPFEPTATRIAGVYVAGAAAGPRTIARAIRDGTAAAGLVLASLAAGERKPLEPLAAEIDEALCGGCGVCASACPFGAVTRAPGTGKARVEAVLCRGCGTCAAGCPTGAASARHFTRAQITAEISALLASGS